MTPSRLQTKLTSSETLRGITGWGEPGARQTSLDPAPHCSPQKLFPCPQLYHNPSCSGDTDVLICIIHEGRRDGGDLNQVVTLSSWQPLPYARPAGRACGVRYHKGLAGAPYSPPFRPALFQPVSLLSKPTPGHSDHISKVPLDLARARLLYSPSEACLACGRGGSAVLPNLLPVATGMISVCRLRQYTQAPRVTVPLGSATPQCWVFKAKRQWSPWLAD